MTNKLGAIAYFSEPPAVDIFRHYDDDGAEWRYTHTVTGEELERYGTQWPNGILEQLGYHRTSKWEPCDVPADYSVGVKIDGAECLIEEVE